MIEDIIRRNRRYAGFRGQCGEVAQPQRVARAAADGERHISAGAEDALRPRERRLGRRIGAVGKEQCKKALVTFLDIDPDEMARQAEHPPELLYTHSPTKY